MRSTVLKLATLTVMTLALSVGSAMAALVAFDGTFTLEDSGDLSESVSILSFSSDSGAYSGDINYLTSPTGDLVEGGYVTIADIFIDQTSGVDGNDGFTDFTATQDLEDDEFGFILYDADGNMLLQANIDPIIIEASDSLFASASINSSFTINLTDIETYSGYTDGDSAIIDAFLANVTASGVSIYMYATPPGMTGMSFENLISGGVSASGDYAGSATPVPEPAATFLFSIGAAGFAGVIRKKRLQK